MRRTFRVTVKIYSLSDYEDNVFYVGCTAQELKTRLSGHLGAVPKKYFNKAKREKILSLNKEVKINLLQEKSFITDKVASAVGMCTDLEAKWIRFFLDKGVQLTNSDKELNHLGIINSFVK